jgi:hypothetical protein
MLATAVAGMVVAATPLPAAAQKADAEATLIQLSRQKWLWMAERNVAALSKLFDGQSIFVHMSRTMTKPQELEVISSRNIEYRQADIKDISVRFIGDTAIVASRIDLHAIVGGNVADNPFSVTETYVKEGREWKLGALVFSKRSVPN